MVDPQCPFCRILTGESPAKILYHDELVTAFHDRNPIMPVHILIVPNHHLESVNNVSSEDQAALGRMTLVAGRLADQLGINQSGYRLVINTGPDAFQSVFHLHMHLLGGKAMPLRMAGWGA